MFNAGCFLHEAVVSILAQTFTDFECLVIDDGSNDGAVDALRAIPDPRLRIERTSTKTATAARYSAPQPRTTASCRTAWWAVRSSTLR
ncbi:MAG: glycosyltransferase family 2 protein [Betaproteobacteria bacterium]|nr:glycosyltransferase family 2 protein [Betaproteobacteria bacterium]